MLFYLRIIISIFYILITSTIGILICLFRPRDARNLIIVSRPVSCGVLKIWGIKTEFINKHLLEESKNVIFISNHQHNLDAFLMGSFIPYKTVSIGKQEILYIPIFGLFYYLSGNILIKRRNKKKAYEALQRAGKVILKKQVSVWIMPEGTRNNGTMLPFKKGAFRLAIDIKRPIVPVSISSYQSLDLTAWNAGVVKIFVHDKIDTTKLLEADINHLSDLAYQIIKKKSTNL